MDRGGCVQHPPRPDYSSFTVNPTGSRGGLPSALDLSRMRWTVDEPGDFELVRRVYEVLYPGNAAFSTEDILALLAERPEMLALNRGIGRNQGLQRSLASDRE